MFDKQPTSKERAVSENSKLSQEIINEIRSDLSKSSQRKQADKFRVRNRIDDNLPSMRISQELKGSALDQVNESAIPHEEQDLLEMGGESILSRASREVSKIQYPVDNTSNS